MPLFGNKDKHHHATEPHGHFATNPATGPGTGIGATNYGTDTGAMNSGMNTSGMHGAYDNTGVHHHGAGNMAGVGSGYNEPGYGNHTAGMQHHGGPGAGTAFGSGVHTSGAATNIPPTGVLNDADQSRHGHGGSLSGKAERVIGTLVGSQSLKAKGAEKEAEARAINLQGAELAEAERLEAEAKMRRERAVAHGAHPDNINLGAGVGTNHLGTS